MTGLGLGLGLQGLDLGLGLDKNESSVCLLRNAAAIHCVNVVDSQTFSKFVIYFLHVKVFIYNVIFTLYRVSQNTWMLSHTWPVSRLCLLKVQARTRSRIVMFSSPETYIMDRFDFIDTFMDNGADFKMVQNTFKVK